MKSNKFNRHIPALLLHVILITFSGCTDTDRTASIRLSGAFALYPLAGQWAEAYNKTRQSPVRFDIQAGGAGKGMADALSGTADLGMFSREISQEEKDRGVWWIAVAKDAVVPTISDANPSLAVLQQRGLSREEFKSIFIDWRITRWDQLTGVTSHSQITLFTRSDACGAGDTWAAYLGGKQEDLHGIGIFGDPGLADAVRKDPDGLAYNNMVYVYDTETGLKRPGLAVIPLDVNGNGTIEANENFYGSLQEILEAIANGRYPAPPSRDLYFIAKGKPTDPATLDFLRWVLTDGQSLVTAAGYVPLKAAFLKEELAKLE